MLANIVSRLTKILMAKFITPQSSHKCPGKIDLTFLENILVTLIGA